MSEDSVSVASTSSSFSFASAKSTCSNTTSFARPPETRKELYEEAQKLGLIGVKNVKINTPR